MGALLAILEMENGIPCRACGATYAYPHETKYGACNSCLHKYEYWLRGCGVSDKRRTDDLENFDLWLARFLLMQLKRLDRHGITGACEAMKQQGVRAGERGYQCGSYASELRDGRRVCIRHRKAAHVVFVPNRYVMYDHLEEAVRDLYAKDECFAKIIRSIVNDPHLETT